jgi:ribosomal protein L30
MSGLLVVTLRRGLAGKNATDKLTAAALGLRRTGKSVVVPNDSTMRGQVNKVCRTIAPQLAAAHSRASSPVA